MTAYHTQFETVVKEIIQRVGKHIILGIPLGLGKPVGFLNALYRAAKADTSLQLTIITGLTLAKPTFHSELEKRFAEPIVKRIYGDYEDPLYEHDRVMQTVPDNIKIIEFYLSPGKFIKNSYVQQNYINSSYTNAVRDAMYYSINVIAQQVSRTATDNELYSLSCNTDLFHQVTAHLEALNKDGKPIAIVGEVNLNLPFMPGNAIVKADKFTEVIDTSHYSTLFSIPFEELTTQDHLIGLYASSLIQDDGCLQIGIGKLSNALANALILRHKNNELYNKLLNKLNLSSLATFKTGLYAATEMFSDEYMQLYKAGVLKKLVYDKPDSNDGKIMHAAFFLGSSAFYQQLKELPADELAKFEMTSVSRTNSLLWNPALNQLQRKNAFFINSAMMITLGGAAVSDGLHDLAEVSGVGGQFDFVDMANKMDGARSIIYCPSIRTTKKGVVSNIVWEYPSITIPRYLRDIFITEYGIADCRSKTDSEIIKSILNITDSRFQPGLLKLAKQHGKLAKDYHIPERFLHNYPDASMTGYFKPYPFGCDLTDDEIVIKHALEYLKNLPMLTLAIFSLLALLTFKHNKKIEKYLLRLDLLHPNNIKEFYYKKLISYTISLAPNDAKDHTK